MNSKTHRLVAIPKRVRLHKLHDFAREQGLSIDIDRTTGLPILLERPAPQHEQRRPRGQEVA